MEVLRVLTGNGNGNEARYFFDEPGGELGLVILNSKVHLLLNVGVVSSLLDMTEWKTPNVAESESQRLQELKAQCKD